MSIEGMFGIEMGGGGRLREETLRGGDLALSEVRCPAVGEIRPANRRLGWHCASKHKKPKLDACSWYKLGDIPI